MKRTPFVLTGSEPRDPARQRPAAFGGGLSEAYWGDLSDPVIGQFLRGGGETASGAHVNAWRALSNTALLRAVMLISSSVGMLPLQLRDVDTKKPAKAHPAFALLKREPNNFQTAFDFRSLMEHRVLRKGNAYARIVRGAGLRAGQPIALLPMDPDFTTPRQNSDLSVSYVYRAASGVETTFDPGDVLHLRGFSLDGVTGVSRVQLAKEAIGLALQAELATARMFKNGSFVDGVLQTDKSLSDNAYGRLQRDWAEQRTGAENAGSTAILEEGVKYQPLASTAKDAQAVETRRMQIEEIARVFGVPRPLLMMDETNWGTGVQALGQFFVTYALDPEFATWTQGVQRSLLKGDEKDELEAAFNTRAILQASLAEQGVFFAQALGSGGQKPFMTPNEVRELLDLPAHPDGDGLSNPMTEPTGAADPKEPNDAPAPGSHLRRVV